jgi:hypothetical protein
MINMQLRLTSLFSILLTVFIAQAQQLDPFHYPPEANWEYLQTKETDSLIQVMKFYFISDDTMFFREAISQAVVKVALVDLQYPTFYLGNPYFFAQRFYGPNVANATRTSKNKKLDRFYFYYLNSPELPFTKTVQELVLDVKLDTIPQSEPLVLDSEKVQVYDTKLGQHADSAAYLYLNNGRTIQTRKIYFESNGFYYFGAGTKRNIYKISASMVDSLHCPAPIKHLDLAKRKGYGFSGGLMQGIGFGGFVFGTLITTVSVWFESPSGVVFGTAIDGLSTFLMIRGTKRVQTMQRYKKAVLFDAKDAR